jgi:hypothetical protein
MDRSECEQFATELRALLVERDVLKATTTPPRDAYGIQGALLPRRLREVKGVSYDNGAWVRKGNRWTVLSALIDRAYPDLTDADHAAIYALKDDPWEKVETLEEVVNKWYESGSTPSKTYYDVSVLIANLYAWLAAQEPTP